MSKPKLDYVTINGKSTLTTILPEMRCALSWCDALHTDCNNYCIKHKLLSDKVYDDTTRLLRYAGKYTTHRDLYQALLNHQLGKEHPAVIDPRMQQLVQMVVKSIKNLKKI